MSGIFGTPETLINLPNRDTHVDFYAWDQWGVWRECPVCHFMWGDMYGDMEERTGLTLREIANGAYDSPQKNIDDCPDCHPELSELYWTTSSRPMYVTDDDDDENGEEENG